MTEPRHRRASTLALALLALICHGRRCRDGFRARRRAGRQGHPAGGRLRAGARINARAPPSCILAEMNQINKTFVPAVLPIQAGTPRALPQPGPDPSPRVFVLAHQDFELPLYRGEDAKPVLFDKPGVVKLGCNIHDWMSAIILVLPTPHFAMTDDEGRYACAAAARRIHAHRLARAEPREDRGPGPAVARRRSRRRRGLRAHARRSARAARRSTEPGRDP